MAGLVEGAALGAALGAAPGAVASDLLRGLLRILNNLIQKDENLRELEEHLHRLEPCIKELSSAISRHATDPARPWLDDLEKELIAASILVKEMSTKGLVLRMKISQRLVPVNDRISKLIGEAAVATWASMLSTFDSLTQSMADMKASQEQQMTKPLDPYKAPYPRDAVGLGEKVSEVLQQLGVSGQTIEPGVRAILLHGIGGIGKTTFGNAICAKIPITGRFVAQVEVGEKPTPEKICNLQMNMCERLTGSRQRIGSYGEGQEKLQKHLSECKSPILLFIDNVFTPKDLRMLLPETLDMPDRSRLVITSRDSSVSEGLNQNRIEWEKHAVRQLEMPDSRKLFDHHVGGCPPGKEEQVTEILKICGGLPLALEVVGKHLKAKDRKDKLGAWKSAVDSLKSFQSITGRAENDLNDVLRWSYEQLDKNVQRIFLDICCLLRNREWSWVSCLGSESELDCLKDLSLVKELEGDDKILCTYNSPCVFTVPSTVQVHDLLAALGRHESESSRRRIFVNNKETFREFMEDDEQDRIIDGLVLDLSKEESPSCLAGKLDAMHQSLRILVLHGRLNIEHACQHIPRQLQICSFRPSMTGPLNFPYTKNISRLNKLTLLDLVGSAYHSKIRCNFQDVQLPESLKILQLACVEDLHAFHPDAFKKCTSLQRLSISNCDLLKELPPSFCLLEELCTLVLHYNRRMREEILPDMDELKSLETVSIKDSTRELPSGIDKLSKLRNLRVEGVQGFSDDLDLSGLTHLSRLALLVEDGRVYNYIRAKVGRVARPKKAFPKGLEKLVALESLELAALDFEELPSDFDRLKNLQRLALFECFHLKALPGSIVLFDKLQYLSIEGCQGVRELPRSFGDLVTLQELHLTYCSLEALPDNIGRLTSLTELDMSGCHKLTNLPDNFGDLVALQSLSLCYCENLKALPNSIARLKNLEELDMRSCEALEKLPDNIGCLTKLESLDMRRCRKLTNLPNSIVRLKNLRSLRLDECTGLMELPNDIVSFARSLEAYCLPEHFGLAT